MREADKAHRSTRARLPAPLQLTSPVSPPRSANDTPVSIGHGLVSLDVGFGDATENVSVPGM